MKISLIFCVFFLCSCTMVGHVKVEGWPMMTVVRHDVPNKVMRDVCGAYAPPFSDPLACSIFDLKNQECHMYFSKDFPPIQSTIEHEELHCQGYDHIGSTYLQQLLKEFIK